MSASTRSIDQVWKFRPRISMIEQKLQSNVQPREVSTTSMGRPRRCSRSARGPPGSAAARPRPPSELTGSWRRAMEAAGRSSRTGRATAATPAVRVFERPQQLPERDVAFAPDDHVGTRSRRPRTPPAPGWDRSRRPRLDAGPQRADEGSDRSAVRRWNVMTDRPTTSGCERPDQALDRRADRPCTRIEIGDRDLVVACRRYRRARRAHRSASAS